ncbi:MAG: hypothetical protein RL141_1091 [Candidatus Parcubacteria bacterium]|jgi:uncharacterized LabA/DUF88 family protein
MIKRPEQRVAVFIDTQNMYHSAKHLYGARLNFAKLVEKLIAGRTLVRAFAYVARSKAGDEKAFLEALESAGIELRIKDVIEFSSGERKADWDVGMAIDAVKFSDRVDAIVLVTGDGDFVPLVEYLQAKGIMVEAAAFAESTSRSLKEAVDEYFDISEHRRTLLMGSGILNGFRRATRTTPTTDEGFHAHPNPITEEREQEMAREEELDLGTKKSVAAPRAATKRKVRITT